ncbi:MAG: hypothetical protein HY904_04070 [Deltaproteobacteria bacterium]|nr:hypothetical protein [Deltaproteobacteria bacterium]
MRRAVALLLLAGCASTAPARVSREPAAPPPADPAAVRAFLDEAARAGSPEETVALCARVLTWERPLDQCDVTAAGPVAVIRVAERCNDAGCEVSAFLLRDAVPRKVAGYTGGNIAVRGDGATVFADHVALEGAGATAHFTAYVVQTDVVTAQVTKVADCTGPSVAADGSLLCRSRRGDVLRVPPTGGAPVLLTPSCLEEGQVAWDPQHLVFPGPVDLNTDGTFSAVTQLTDPAAPAHVFRGALAAGK